jgi:hypothetical protein
VENDLIERFTKKTGLKRYKKTDRLPDKLQNIMVYVVLGDFHSTIFSSTVFKKLIGQTNSYNVILTWPGFQHLFDTEEVLTLDTSIQFKTLHATAKGLINKNNNLEILFRSLNEYFLQVFNISDVIQDYKETLDLEKLKYRSLDFQAYNFLKFSDSLKPVKMNKNKVIFFPIDRYQTIFNNKSVDFIFDYKIYINIFKELSKLGFEVACIQNRWTFNFKDKPLESDVKFISEDDIDKILMHIRCYGCFVDLFSDISLLGHLAQVPTFSLYERSYFSKNKRDVEFFVLDQTGRNHIIFSFFNSFHTSEGLNYGYIESIIDRFVNFYDESVVSFSQVLIEKKEVNFAPYLKKINSMKKAKFISKLFLQKEREKHEKG